MEVYLRRKDVAIQQWTNDIFNKQLKRILRVVFRVFVHLFEVKEDD